MKIRLLIIISLFATNLIKNENSGDESGHESKLYKSFDEIFGKGWNDESNDSKVLNCRHVKEEVQDGQAPNTSDQKNVDEILKQKFDEIYDKNWSEDDNELVEEDEADSTDQNVSIDGQKCQKVQENGTRLIKIRKNDYSDLQKREIVEEFIKMKNEYKQKGKYSHKEWDQNNSQIANSIGVNHFTIKKWKKEFGLSIQLHSKKEQMEKLKQYCEIKKNNPKIKDFEIAESLNITRRTLNQWKRQLKNSVKDENNCSLQKELDQISQNNVIKSKFSELERCQILEQFDKIKSKCKKAKLKNFSKNELDEKIGKKLGVSRASIIRWKREFGLTVSKKISDVTKIEILKKYAKIKRKHPKLTNAVIAEMLKISTQSLHNWKKQFQEENKNL